MVYWLLPVAIAGVSRKLQVQFVGPYPVTRIVNECLTEIMVDQKLVSVHNGHLVIAIGDKPLIVVLRDV